MTQGNGKVNQASTAPVEERAMAMAASGYPGRLYQLMAAEPDVQSCPPKHVPKNRIQGHFRGPMEPLCHRARRGEASGGLLLLREDQNVALVLSLRHSAGETKAKQRWGGPGAVCPAVHEATGVRHPEAENAVHYTRTAISHPLSVGDHSPSAVDYFLTSVSHWLSYGPSSTTIAPPPPPHTRPMAQGVCSVPSDYVLTAR